ncbi:hypothetical protein MBELCI_1408 [Limimaricola cinnabarinus LL-001]|uniref:Uncharacterized protein n=1 Tax=Limimaricola cinnabarinus LL-001 TaxID=1337093 RepID=U2YKA5_9RHOB|nr:hypothetical protein MBELCI_1408 [Limimaricola cinnabarinus LL-001]
MSSQNARLPALGGPCGPSRAWALSAPVPRHLHVAASSSVKRGDPVNLDDGKFHIILDAL